MQFAVANCHKLEENDHDERSSKYKRVKA